MVPLCFRAGFFKIGGDFEIYKIMYESRIEINGNQKYLICFYDRDRTNFDEVISRALNKFKLKPGQVPVLCLPKKRGNHVKRH